MLKAIVFFFSLFSQDIQKGDIICWVSSIKTPECGTYGWSKGKSKKSKEIAIEKAYELCVQYCKEPCKLDYCE